MSTTDLYIETNLLEEASKILKEKYWKEETMDNKDMIDKLEKLFSELLNIIEQHGKGEIDYQISEVRYVVNLLRENINNEYSNSEDIISEIKTIHKNLYPARGGLSEFFIWKNDLKERIKVNEPLSRVGDEIWKLLK